MQTYIHRELEDTLAKYMRSKEIIAIVGTRQCGKTTLINSFLDNLEKNGKKTSRVSFDDLKVLRLFENDIDSFVSIYIAGFDILFIDEVHYSKDSGKKLKYIYDNHYLKIFISGSSAAEISIHSLKYLVGRIFTFTLYPFSFEEFLSFKSQKLAKVHKHGEYGEVILEQLNKYLEEFLLYGGYPRVVLAESIAEKEKVLESIFNTYLLKEIREILSLSENHSLIDLMKALSLQTGNIINYNELSSLTKFSYLELRKYLNILEKTYISSLVRPFYTNKRTELVKNPKVYFFDNGFRNACIGNFTKERSDLGKLYENFVFSELLKKGYIPRFWNTKSKAEVDFILEKNSKLIPVEVKSLLYEKKITRSFGEFLKKYKPRTGFFLSPNLSGKKTIGNCIIHFLPFVEFIRKIPH